MNSFKLLVVFILLLLGSFAQRFQRHSINGTQNGYVNGNKEMNNLDNLASDGENAVQEGNDVKFVGNEREGVELELENKELMFKFCSDGCMDKVVIACYNSTDSNHMLRGDCGPGQCEFRAGVSKQRTYGTKFLWFMSDISSKSFNNNEKICENATMMSPEAKVHFTSKFPSCDPLKHDGNVVKLYVIQAPPGCPFYVLNAKKWTPPSTTTAQNSSGTTVPNQTTSKSSEANTTLWIGISVGIFILLIVLMGFGYCCYRTQIQKKPLFGKKKELQPTAFIPESSEKANVVKETTEDEKEAVAKPKPPKEPTAAKEKQQEPAKKKAPKEKKAAVLPKPSKEVTQEDNPPPPKKVSVEPTVEDPTTEASILQKPIVQQKQPKPGDPPRVFVPKTVYHPEPKSVNAPKSGSLKTGKKDSLSGRHEIGMEFLVESTPEQVKRHDINIGLLNDETKEKLEKFYPPGPVHSFDRREIELLCCARISLMFKIIEALVDDAMKALAERGVTFDEKSNIIKIPPKAEKYLRLKKTPEFVKSFAFGNVFREYIDSQANFDRKLSIPLLFSIVLQRRYSVVNRRKACTWIRRELPIIQKEFTALERSKLAYPICAIEAAYEMNTDGFQNIVLLDSLSGEDDDVTQNSTTEKLGKKFWWK